MINRRVTIKDIAEDTGFSITTVSLVLNNRPSKIPKKTKDTVLACAKRLGYRPNQLAVGLVKKTTNTIGLIVSDVSNAFFATLAKGCEEACRHIGVNLILCNSGDKHTRELDYIHMLADKRVDGIVFGMSAESDSLKAKESCQLIESLGLPFVLVDRSIDTAHYHTVAAHHIKGGYLATSHLTQLGHHRIACVTGPSHLQDSKYRLSGYRQALASAQIPYDSRLIIEGQYTYQSGIRAMKKLNPADYSAVFAFNDLTAYGVYRYLRSQGFEVPGDKMLVGYDNIFFSALTEVPLTTVNQPAYQIGETAVNLLERIIKGDNTIPAMTLINPTLIVRESTAAQQSINQHLKE